MKFFHETACPCVSRLNRTETEFSLFPSFNYYTTLKILFKHAVSIFRKILFILTHLPDFSHLFILLNETKREIFLKENLFLIYSNIKFKRRQETIWGRW